MNPETGACDAMLTGRFRFEDGDRMKESCVLPITDVVWNGPVMCPEAILRLQRAWLIVTSTSTRTTAPRTWAGFKSGTAVFSTCTSTFTCLTTLLPANMVHVSKIVAHSKTPIPMSRHKLNMQYAKALLTPKRLGGTIAT